MNRVEAGMDDNALLDQLGRVVSRINKLLEDVAERGFFLEIFCNSFRCAAPDDEVPQIYIRIEKLVSLFNTVPDAGASPQYKIYVEMAECLRLRNKGLSLRAIAKELNMPNQSYVQRRLKKAGSM